MTGAERGRRYRQRHPDRAAESQRLYMERNPTAKAEAGRRKRAKEDPEAARTRRARWAAKNPDYFRAHYLKRYGGMTMEQFDAMLAEQGGCCALCGAPEPGGTGRWHVDHDHSCCPTLPCCADCVRGLLCSRCNLGLGQFRDDPSYLEQALAYLRRHSASRTSA